MGLDSDAGWDIPRVRCSTLKAAISSSQQVTAGELVALCVGLSMELLAQVRDLLSVTFPDIAREETQLLTEEESQHWFTTVGGDCAGRQLGGGAGAGGPWAAVNHTEFLVFLFATLFLLINQVALKFTFQALKKKKERNVGPLLSRDLSGGEDYECMWLVMESL